MSRDSRIVVSGLVLIFAAVCVAAVFCLFLSALQVVKWVGQADLLIVITVVDEVSGRPIASAKITTTEIEAVSDLLPDSLITDSVGMATIETKRMMTGSRSLLEDTAFISLPTWQLVASANGYFNSEPLVVYNQPQPPRSELGEPWVMPLTMTLHRDNLLDQSDQ